MGRITLCRFWLVPFVVVLLALCIGLVWPPVEARAATFDVTAYGATGNGIFDDTASIQAAIDAAARAGGGVVLIPSGTYQVSQLLIAQSGVTLAGSGPWSTIRSSSPQVIRIGVTGTLTGVSLRDFSIVGNYEAEGQIGVRIAGLTKGSFERLFIRDMNFAGIFSLGTLESTVFAQNTITHCGDFGIQIKAGSRGNIITGNTMAGFASLHYPAHGIYVEQSVDTTVSANVVRQVSNAPNMYEVSGIKITESDGALVEDNVIEDSYAAVSIPGARNVTVRGNVGRRMVERGFYILAGSAFCTLEDNLIDGAPRGFVFDQYPSWPSDIIVRNNTLVNVPTLFVLGQSQRVQISGTSTVIDTTATPPPAPVGIAPAVVAVVTPTAGVAPLTVQFDGSLSKDADGSIVSYEWSFDDGTKATGPVTTKVFTTPGGHAASLKVTDSAGLSSSAQTEVVVTSAPINGAPVAALTATPTAGVAPLTVTFDGSASSDPENDALSYQWAFGDGTAGTGRQLQHVYTALGTYTATLTVNDGRGGSASREVGIQVQSAPVFNLSVASLELTTVTVAGGRQAVAVARVVDEKGSAVPGVMLTGQWSGAVTGTARGLTGADGVASVTSKKFKRGIPSFIVRGLAKSGYSYEPSVNSVTLTTTKNVQRLR